MIATASSRPARSSNPATSGRGRLPVLLIALASALVSAGAVLAVLARRVDALLWRRRSAPEHRAAHHRFTHAGVRPNWHGVAAAAAPADAAAGGARCVVAQRPRGRDTIGDLLRPGRHVSVRCRAPGFPKCSRGRCGGGVVRTESERALSCVHAHDGSGVFCDARGAAVFHRAFRRDARARERRGGRDCGVRWHADTLRRLVSYPVRDGIFSVYCPPPVPECLRLWCDCLAWADPLAGIQRPGLR